MVSGITSDCTCSPKTICDKISRLVKLSYNENANALLTKHIRDVYDLSALFHNLEYKEYLLSDEFLEAMYKVTLEDGLKKNSRSHLSLADAPIFKEAKTTMEQPGIWMAYTTDLKRLTFNKEKMPTVRKAVEALKRLYGVLVGFEEFRKEKE